MLRSTTFNNYVDNCDTVEQVLDLCLQCLDNRYYASSFLTTGLTSNGAPIYSPMIEHWSGTQLIGEKQNELHTISSFATRISVAYKQSLTPWMEVLPIGDPADTPNGVFS